MSDCLSLPSGPPRQRRLLCDLLFQFLPAVDQSSGELGAELGNDDVAVAFADAVLGSPLCSTSGVLERRFLQRRKRDDVFVSETFDSALHVVVTNIQQLGNLAALAFIFDVAGAERSAAAGAAYGTLRWYRPSNSRCPQNLGHLLKVERIGP